MRVSTLDQHPESQLHDLRQVASQRASVIIAEFTDRVSGAKAKRQGLDQMMADARRGRFDVVLAWASDQIARSVKHFLEVLEEFNRLGTHFKSSTKQLDRPRLRVDLSPFLRQPVKTQNPMNGELSHGIVTQEVHQGV